MVRRVSKETPVPSELKAVKGSRVPKVTTETKVDKEPPAPTVPRETRGLRACRVISGSRDLLVHPATAE